MNKEKIYRTKKYIVYCIISILNIILPKNNKKIFIEDIVGVKDNHRIIYDYLIKKNVNNEYIIVYFSVNNNDNELIDRNNVKVISNTVQGILHKVTAKYVLFGYGQNRFDCKVNPKQLVINLWHGSPLKKIGYSANSNQVYRLENTFSHLLVASEFFRPIMKESFRCSDEQILIGGNPRNDFLFTNRNVLKDILINKNDFEHISFFMPTFRNSNKFNINNYENDFPLFDSNNIDLFNEKLKNKKILLIIKPHHAQKNIDIFKKKYSNIKIIFNEDLDKSNLYLYEALSQVDSLITDYSSVYFDYLLLNKPIGFIVDDIEEYKAKRGFVIDNPYELMPGEKIKNLGELEKFFDDLLIGNDKYKVERSTVNEIVNKYKDNRNCSRILEFMELSYE